MGLGSGEYTWERLVRSPTLRTCCQCETSDTNETNETNDENLARNC
jgi:hypothetical protein